MRPAYVEHVLTSHILTTRLLLLQSKRLLLAAAERQATLYGTERLRDRVERLRGEAGDAQIAYQNSVLNFAPPHHPDYWTIAYGRLIYLGNKLTDNLMTASNTAGPHERFGIATDVEKLEDLIAEWRRALRGKMGAA